jgi:hypothetical protein
MDNLKLYENLKIVPKEAQKAFNNGRFSGTDINSMWRIKKLTETFGVCGIGWYVDILEQWIETGKEEEKIANVKVALYIKQENEWSKPIIGIGGNKLATYEKKKEEVYVSDECYKMAYTDAIGSACKMLGMGADIYWSEDRTKYNNDNKEEPQKESLISEGQMATIKKWWKTEELMQQGLEYFKVKKLEDITMKQASNYIAETIKKAKEKENK